MAPVEACGADARRCRSGAVAGRRSHGHSRGRARRAPRREYLSRTRRAAPATPSPAKETGHRVLRGSQGRSPARPASAGSRDAGTPAVARYRVPRGWGDCSRSADRAMAPGEPEGQPRLDEPQGRGRGQVDAHTWRAAAWHTERDESQRQQDRGSDQRPS